MKNITVGNIVKIYRRCRKDVQRANFVEGNIVLNFLVEKGICTEDAECNLTQRAFGAKMTSDQRRCDVITSHRR